MEIYHYCDYCTVKCAKKYNEGCDTLKKKTIKLNDDDIDIVMGQIHLLAVNLPPDKVADAIYNVFYTMTSWKTSQNVMKRLHDRIESEKDWKI